MKPRSTSLLTSLPFISFTQQNGYLINQQSVQLLRSHLTSDHSCTVIGLVGRAKSGKSYLLNHLIDHLQSNRSQIKQYFPVCDGINTSTKGIRLMPTEIDGQSYIFLEMEGLGSLTSNSCNQGKLFAIALLLSTVLLYNTFGPLDQQGLQSLSILVQIGKLLENSLLSNSKQKLQFPSLIVLLRDFSLVLEDEDGNAISSKKYLENALQELRGGSVPTANKNRIRRVLKDIFHNRECQTFSLPSQEIPIHTSSLVREQFKNQISKLGVKISKQQNVNKKKLNGKQINVQQWINFAQLLINTVNNQSKQGSLKLEGLLLQVYRQQQGSVREKFSLITRSLLEKAESRYQQAISIAQTLADIDGDQIIETVNRAKEAICKILEELQSNYQKACCEIQQLIHKQSGNDFPQIKTDFNRPSLSSIKDFSEIYQIKQTVHRHLTEKRQNLNKLIKQNEQKLEKIQLQNQQEGKFSKFFEQLNLMKTEKQLDKKYINFIYTLKGTNTSLDSKAFESHILRLEVAYLRRKLQCKDRQNSMKNQYCHEDYNQRILKHQKQNQPKTAKTNKRENQKQITAYRFDTFCSKEMSAFIGEQQSNKKSFLTPYLTIQHDQINIEILRTLVKQDNRGNNSIQYILQVILMDKRWNFSRRWKDFNQLHNILNSLFSQHQLPPFTPGTLVLTDQLLHRKQEVELRRSRLQNYIRQLLKVKEVLNSRIFQKFLKINKEYIPTL